MNPNRPPEIELLLLVCIVDLTPERRAQLIQFLDQYTIDWERLNALANRHRITPFLYRTLQQIPNIPTDFLETLQQECRATATDNLLKIHQYQQLNTLLTDQGIAHLALKGAYLAQHFYPEAGLRPTGDIDLLIGKEKALETIRFLESKQYQLGSKHQLYLQQSGQGILDELYEVSLFKAFFSSSFDIDLHWSVMCFNKDYQQFTLNDIVGQPAFSREMEIVLLVIHHGVNNVWQHIYYANDLYFLVADKPLNWTWLMQTMLHHGLEQVFLVGLHWCQQIWQLPLPSSVQEAVDAKSTQSLANAYEKNWQAKRTVELSSLILQQLLLFTKAQTRFSTILKIWGTFISSRVFRASTFTIGKRRLYISKEFGFITIFLRVFGSLYRFLPTRH